MRDKRNINRLKFSKREKRGSLVLLLVTLTLFVLPKLIDSKSTPLRLQLTEEEEVMSNEFKNTKAQNKSQNKKKYQKYNPNNNRDTDYKRPMPETLFDPDTMSAESWQKLGLSEKQSDVLISYRNRIGGFYQIEQLYDAYVLDKERVNEWKEFLVFNKKKPAVKKIELNTASKEELMSLKGIGDKLSDRIITYREKLGGFHSVDQLKDVYGIQVETFQNIRAQLRVDVSKIKSIDINNLEIKELAAHPYIDFNMAKLLVNYRKQHGDFQKADDLLNCYGITPEEVAKIKPYINFAP